MIPVSVSEDDPRIGDLASVVKMVVRKPVKEAVKEALEEHERESTAVVGPTDGTGSDGGRIGGDGSLISGRNVAIGLAAVGGAAYLANRRGWIPGRRGIGIDVGRKQRVQEPVEGTDESGETAGEAGETGDTVGTTEATEAVGEGAGEPASSGGGTEEATETGDGPDADEGDEEEEEPETETF